MKKYSDHIQQLLKTVVDDCDKEDRAVRERQLRTWRRLKLLWEGFSRVWYSEVAHDWRIWDEQLDENIDQGSYDKPVNVFRAYLESIIAALSVTVPPVKCYPDDADNTLDLSTARAGDKISQLVYRHNDASLLWVHALFIYCTEGMVACYSYPKENKDFGTYSDKKYEDVEENHQITSCPQCGNVIDDQLIDDQKDKFQPDDSDVELDAALDNSDLCPVCMAQMQPQIEQQKFIVTRLAGVTQEPKTRICMEAYGGMNIKVPNYARKQEDCPYLIYSYETHYAMAIEQYEDLRGNKQLMDSMRTTRTAGSYDQYDQWARLSPQYNGEYPINVVTVKQSWLRPASFNIINDEDDVKLLKKTFPDGAKTVFVNDCFATAENEALDDCWTINYNPLADYIHYGPIGLLLASIQEITNDLISLVLQTIEHGIGSTMADPSTFNFKAYEQTEVLPGSIFPATPKTGKSLSDSFYELKTATLSGEVMPFSQKIQELGQLVSGATPALFGGQQTGVGGDTASGYAMSRAQSLQRLQNTWKMLTGWWKNIFGKVIPMYIEIMKEQGDERDVQKTPDGGFLNVFIRKAELEGKIGKVELEANENLPLTWNQQKDLVMQLLQAQNPEVVKIISAPENLTLIHEALGLDEFYIPGEDDILAEYDEIKILLSSEPITVPVPLEMLVQAQQAGVEPPQPSEIPSIEPEPLTDNHAIRFEIDRKWAVSEAGRQAKVDNPNGYKNVLLHAKMHFDASQPPPPLPPPPKISYSFGGPDLVDPDVKQILDRTENINPTSGNGNGNGNGAANPPKPNPLMTQDAPITGEGNATVQ